MLSKYGRVAGYVFVVLFTLTSYAAAAGIHAAVATGSERFLQGQVLTETCLIRGYCALDKHERGDLILFTPERMVYRLQPNRIAAAKLDQLYGQQVFVKGILQGQVLLVNDLAGGGNQAISKACL